MASSAAGGDEEAAPAPPQALASPCFLSPGLREALRHLRLCDRQAQPPTVLPWSRAPQASLKEEMPTLRETLSPLQGVSSAVTLTTVKSKTKKKQKTDTKSSIVMCFKIARNTSLLLQFPQLKDENSPASCFRLLADLEVSYVHPGPQVPSARCLDQLSQQPYGAVPLVSTSLREGTGPRLRFDHLGLLTQQERRE